MGRKHKIEPYQVAPAQSLAASFQTDPTDVSQTDIIKYTVQTTGVTDNTGVFSIQIRDIIPNTEPANPTATPWTTLTLDTAPTLNNADVTFAIIANQFVASQIRLAFAASGTVPDGTCIVTVHASTVGA